MSASEYYLQGQQGGVVLAAGDSASGSFREILVVNAAVLSSLTSSNVTDAGGDLVGATLPAGLRLGGKFSGVGVTSGIIVAYYD